MKALLFFLNTAWSRLRYHKSAVLMSILSVAMSVTVLLGVEHIRAEAKANFTNTIANVDLIVGPRTGKINLLLYSVFRLGNPTNNIAWRSVEAIKKHPKVDWVIPISLGDSHKGFRVMGTENTLFKHYQYGQKQPLEMAEGKEFKAVEDVVLGAVVAQKLGYSLGKKLVLSHGIASSNLNKHDDSPFSVVGILAPTGTPIDNTLFVSLESIEAIHKNWKKAPAGFAKSNELRPKNVTALMIGLNSKIATFAVQRWVNNYRGEPLMAILPGVVLMSLWNMMSTIETTLLIISALIFIATLFGIMAMLLSAMRERKPELKILRSLGASPLLIYLLIALESLLIVLIGIAIALVLLFAGLWLANALLSTYTGMLFSLNIFHPNTLMALGAIILCVAVISIVPAIKAYQVAKTA